MITIANCYDIQEARSLQMALTAADIPSFIPDEATAQNVPFFVGSEAGVRLQVPEENVVEAQQVIKDARPKASPDDHASDPTASNPAASNPAASEPDASEPDEEEQRV